MNKNEILDIVDNLKVSEKIQLTDIPEIDLYMDQVIQLFESKLSVLKRKEDDKVLTKTMINNYAKDKLLMSIKNKKYSKEHLILMSLIYDLKGSLSINDIKLLVDNIVKKYDNEEEYNLREVYESYLELNRINCSDFKKSVNEQMEQLSELTNSNEAYGEFEGKFLLVCSMISMSNMYRKLGESIIDEFFSEGDK